MRLVYLVLRKTAQTTKSLFLDVEEDLNCPALSTRLMLNYDTIELIQQTISKVERSSTSGIFKYIAPRAL